MNGTYVLLRGETFGKAYFYILKYIYHCFGQQDGI